MRAERNLDEERAQTVFGREVDAVLAKIAGGQATRFMADKRKGQEGLRDWVTGREQDIGVFWERAGHDMEDEFQRQGHWLEVHNGQSDRGLVWPRRREA